MSSRFNCNKSLQSSAHCVFVCLFVTVCLQPRGALENALKGHASSIRQIHREQVVPMEQAMVITSHQISSLLFIASMVAHTQANTHRCAAMSEKTNQSKDLLIAGCAPTQGKNKIYIYIYSFSFLLLFTYSLSSSSVR